MSNKIEAVKEYRERLVQDLGIWAEDPRAIASVDARTQRVAETLVHMDRPSSYESTTTEMQPDRQYSLK